MNRNDILKIVGIVAAAAASLVTAGVFPGWVAIVATAVGTAAGGLHAQVMPPVAK